MAGRPFKEAPWGQKITESSNWVKKQTKVGKPRKVDSPKKKKVEKPQDGRQKSSQNIGNPYQMEDNKNPKGAARSAAPLGRRRRRRLVVFHLVRISYVFASFLEPVLTPGIICSPVGRINFLIRAGIFF